MNIRRNIPKALIVTVGLILYGQFSVCSRPAESPAASAAMSTDEENFIITRTRGRITVGQVKDLIHRGEALTPGDPIFDLTWAAESNRLDLLPSMLIQPIYKKCINQYDKQLGITPLGYAATKGHCQAARLLLEAGAQIYHPGRDKFTPFMRAALNGQHEMIQFLYEKAPNKNKIVQETVVLNGIVGNALSLAVVGVCPRTVSLLLQYKSNLVLEALEVASSINFSDYKRGYTASNMSDDQLKAVNRNIISLLKDAANKLTQERADEVIKEFEAEEREQAKSGQAKKNDKVQVKRQKAIERQQQEQAEAERSKQLEQQKKEAKRAEAARQKAQKDVEYDAMLEIARQALEAQRRAEIQEEAQAREQAQRDAELEAARLATQHRMLVEAQIATIKERQSKLNREIALQPFLKHFNNIWNQPKTEFEATYTDALEEVRAQTIKLTPDEMHGLLEKDDLDYVKGDTECKDDQTKWDDSAERLLDEFDLTDQPAAAAAAAPRPRLTARTGQRKIEKIQPCMPAQRDNLSMPAVGLSARAKPFHPSSVNYTFPPAPVNYKKR